MTPGAENYDDSRDDGQRLVDRLLLLYLFDRVSEVNRITGDVKLQKLVFLSEKEMIENEIQGMNYNFFRWDLGPMSKGVYEDHAFLCENELVSESDGTILSTGERILSKVVPLLQKNPEFARTIDDIVQSYGSISGGRLKNIVYDKEVNLPGEDPVAVRDIQRGKTILDPVKEQYGDTTFDLPEEWIETLSIMLDPDARESVEEAITQAKNQPSSRFSISND